MLYQLTTWVERGVHAVLIVSALLFFFLYVSIHFGYPQARFPIWVFLAAGCGCLIGNVLFFTFQAWVQPEPR